MTVNEIFAKINNHMLEGIMLHDQLASYYDFLDLAGYKRCHKYHVQNEMNARRKLLEYYTCHYGHAVPEAQAADPHIIPTNWNGHMRSDVDAKTKQRAVRDGFSHWHEWEKSTKKLYENAYKELFELEEIAAAMRIGKLIEDVDCELKDLEKETLKLASIDYDLNYIYECQPKIHKKYKRMMKGD